MKRFILVFLCMTCLALLGATALKAGEQAKGYTGSKEFERMKELAGKWEGTGSREKGGEQAAKADYRLTSGGSVVIETLFPGTSEEMVTVYNDIDGKLSMTHYCMLRNQPRMKLMGSDENTLKFDFDGGANVDPKKDPHMHALTIRFVDRDHITQKWTYFENGAEKGSTTINLSRVK